MSIRTTPTAVQAILARNYITGVDLAPYIEIASSITDDVAVCATSKGRTQTSAKLELIERWLSAHFYTKMDPLYQARATDEASGRFHSSPDDYLEGAMTVDSSNCVRNIMKNQVAGASWLGKPRSQQIDYQDRD